MNKLGRFVFLIVFITAYVCINAQTKIPEFSFTDNVISHTAHITYFQGYYYTCNGGKVDDGKISVFDSKGKFVVSYPIKLDMRSIAFNKNDNSFYISTMERKIYLITNLKEGKVELKYADLYEDGNSAITFSPDGKWLFIFDHGTLKKFDFRSGEQIHEISGFFCGDKASTGSNTLALDGKYYYTWDSSKKLIYSFSKKGKFKKSFKILEGDFGFTLSYANGYIFVATDADSNSKGVWYAYKLWD